MQSAHCVLTLIALVLLLLSGTSPGFASPEDEPVTVTYNTDGRVQYVVAKLKIPYTVEQVWPVMANPYEFEQKISPRFHNDEVLLDTDSLSVMSCHVNTVAFLPPIRYTVQSKYEKRRRITFHSLSGDLKDFRGSWELDPADGGKSSLVTYSLFVQPNLPVPQWVVRHAVKAELPHVLKSLRERVRQLATHRDVPADRRLAATGELPLN